MRVAAVFLFAILMMPVVLEIRFDTDEHTLIAGSVRLSFYGVSVRIPFRIVRGDGFYLQIASSHRIRVHFRPKKRSIPSDSFRKNITSWKRSILFHIDLHIGTGDACSTALCCGALQAVVSTVPRIACRIVPLYDRTGYRLKVHCIAVFRLGKLFLTAALAILDRMAAKQSGGKANGNRAEQANQLRHADGP